MSEAKTVFSKPQVMRKLSPFYLQAGVLTTLAQELLEPFGEFAHRNHLLTIDDQPDLRGPDDLPENWPVGIIRVYREDHQQLDENAEAARERQFGLNLDTVSPMRVGVNNDTVGYSESYILDNKGILAFETDLRGRKKELRLVGFYLMIDESEQLSLIPSIGTPTTEYFEDLLKLVPEGLLDGYYQRKATETFQESCVKEEFNEEELLSMKGLGMHYINWEFANCVIAAQAITAMQYKKVQGPVEVQAPATQVDAEGKPITSDVFGKPIGTEPSNLAGRTIANAVREELHEAKVGEVVQELSQMEQELAKYRAENPSPLDVPGITVIDVEAQVTHEYQAIHSGVMDALAASGYLSEDMAIRAAHIASQDDIYQAPYDARGVLGIDRTINLAKWFFSREQFAYDPEEDLGSDYAELRNSLPEVEDVGPNVLDGIFGWLNQYRTLRDQLMRNR